MTDVAEEARQLDALLLDVLPAGIRSRTHERSDAFTGHVWHRVQVYPETVDPDTRPAFGPGVVAEIEWAPDRGGYLVYVCRPTSGSYVQSCGRVRVFDAAMAVQYAHSEVTWELLRQARGW